ncbi:MAG: hypothetical protein K2P90_01890 [Holosporales bacterium]|nr:hypothetical protein [Holosporales bacterium]
MIKNYKIPFVNGTFFLLPFLFFSPYLKALEIEEIIETAPVGSEEGTSAPPLNHEAAETESSSTKSSNKEDDVEEKNFNNEAEEAEEGNIEQETLNHEEEVNEETDKDKNLNNEERAEEESGSTETFPEENLINTILKDMEKLKIE